MVLLEISAEDLSVIKLCLLECGCDSILENLVEWQKEPKKIETKPKKIGRTQLKKNNK